MRSSRHKPTSAKPLINRGEQDSRFGRTLSLQVVASRNNVSYQALTTGTDVPRTYRSQHIALVNIASLTLRYSNSYGTAAGAVGDGPANIVLTCSVEINGTAVSSGAIVRGYVGGARQFTILPGGTVDVTIPVAITKGTAFYVRTCVVSGQVGTGIFGNWASGRGGVDNVGTGASTNGEGDNGSAGGDQTTTGLPSTNGFDRLYSPLALLGTTYDGPQPCLGLVGDSVMNGYADIDDVGFGRRVGVAAGIPYINLAMPGEMAKQFALNGSAMSLIEQRYALLRYVTHAICNYGVNDVNALQSTSLVETSLVTTWTTLQAFGIKTWQTTIIPRTSSTDGWTTLTNMTIYNSTAETNRRVVNAWLRDGAPIQAGAPVAVGTTGSTVSRCAYTTSAGVTTAATGPTHPLQGVIETTDLLESARDSGLHDVSQVRSVSGVSGTANQAVISSASSAFTSADLGLGIYVPGADTSGGNLTNFVSRINSGVNINIAGQVKTTVSSVTAKVGAKTVDGLHPAMWWHVAAANLISSVVNLTL